MTKSDVLFTPCPVSMTLESVLSSAHSADLERFWALQCITSKSQLFQSQLFQEVHVFKK